MYGVAPSVSTTPSRSNMVPLVLTIEVSSYDFSMLAEIIMSSKACKDFVSACSGCSVRLSLLFSSSPRDSPVPLDERSPTCCAAEGLAIARLGRADALVVGGGLAIKMEGAAAMEGVDLIVEVLNMFTIIDAMLDMFSLGIGLPYAFLHNSMMRQENRKDVFSCVSLFPTFEWLMFSRLMKERVMMQAIARDPLLLYDCAISVEEEFIQELGYHEPPVICCLLAP
ncbi:hypothetical protein HAX54_041222 [Datura stramonium]|uniref:Uncharacterized protein n=1 Tax=Datura stramonium TaxID=4076 RepID=A0ABS8SLB8_DATST|nr:hypothetical protein [Datura stramonium]